MAFEKIAERSAIPFARGQEKRVFGWGGVAFVCHGGSLAQLWQLGSVSETPVGFEDAVKFYQAHLRYFETDLKNIDHPTPIQGR
jgi:hypothetical protein